jgi:L-alanine-DL-glutamate epimerase-like enolase superfamily enzyme
VTGRRSATITRVEVRDVRFPTSRGLDGSDAMNADPDYSATYVILHTDAADGLEGHGLTFTIGRGNELCVAAVRALTPIVLGLSLDEIAADMGAFWHRMVGDSQLRWVGPEKGVIHLATAAIVNAVWDLWAKAEGKPVWKLLADMSPEDIVRCVDFRYITDALTPDEALEILRRQAPARARRERELHERGYPAYTTSAGWLGYSDEKIRRLCREGMAEGWSHFKIKVGRDLGDDLRRAALIREEIGPGSQADGRRESGVGGRRGHHEHAELAQFDPWWIEEPTSPDDVLGHCDDRPGHRADRRRDRRALPESDRLQAAHAGERDRLLSDRRLPPRRGERGDRRAAPRRQVRRARVSARGRRRAVRVRAAPLDVRLRVRQRLAREPDHRVRRPPARAFPRSGRHPRRALRAAHGTRLQHHDATESLDEYAYPDGAAWAGVARPSATVAGR